jgi:hypothetical protein
MLLPLARVQERACAGLVRAKRASVWLIDWIFTKAVSGLQSSSLNARNGIT